MNFYDFFSSHVKNLSSPGAKGQAVGLCPFHEDRNPSFSVNLKTGLWFCFSCNIGGNAVTFYAKLYTLSYRGAAKKMGVQWDDPGKVERERQKLIEKFKEWCWETRKYLADVYRELNKHSPTGQDFLKFPDYYRAFWDIRHQVDFYLEILERGSDRDKFEVFKKVENG